MDIIVHTMYRSINELRNSLFVLVRLFAGSKPKFVHSAIHSKQFCMAFNNADSYKIRQKSHLNIIPADIIGISG